LALLLAAREEPDALEGPPPELLVPPEAGVDVEGPTDDPPWLLPPAWLELWPVVLGRQSWVATSHMVPPGQPTPHPARHVPSTHAQPWAQELGSSGVHSKARLVASGRGHPNSAIMPSPAVTSLKRFQDHCCMGCFVACPRGPRACGGLQHMAPLARGPRRPLGCVGLATPVGDACLSPRWTPRWAGCCCNTAR
jgi:hypothetical protein